MAFAIFAPRAAFRPQSTVLSKPSIRTGRHALLLFRTDEVHHCVDECEVGEGLGEVAVVPACVRVQFFGVEVQWARVAEQFLAERAGPSQLADLRQSRYQPERADREGALVARETVVRLFGPVAQNQSFFGQLFRNGEYGRADTGIVWR